MANKIYLLPVEPLEQRYTLQWLKYLPQKIEDETGKEVVVLMGEQRETETSANAFLNFTDTNHFKNTQMNEVVKEFEQGNVNPNDSFLVLDAWNPTVHEIRYMSELLDVPVKIYGIWHAGSYDPADFLGRKVEDKQWSKDFERSLYFLYDLNFFASEYHMHLFSDGLDVYKTRQDRTGFPFEFLDDLPKRYDTSNKKDQVVFPHRKAPEKNPQLFEAISDIFDYDGSDVNFVFTLDETNTKDEYYQLLAESKIVFSANEQETLGIGTYEAMILGCLPLVPNDLSYYEMYNDAFKYDPKNKGAPLGLAAIIQDYLDKYDEYDIVRKGNLEFIKNNYFHANQLYEVLKRD